ncbi:MAG: Smr/MutS family protein [Sphingobium sp.]
MGNRRLSPDEQALWVALTQSVRPIRRGGANHGAQTPATTGPVDIVSGDAASNGKRAMAAAARILVQAPPRTPAAILDSGWERRIRAGTLSPDMAIDLHGHSLAAAHGRLNQAIAAALTQDARVLLIITGKSRNSEGGAGSSRRGAIRAEIGHWLQTSPYADRIASVRVAHRRHGGDGALYIILRRRKL